MSTRKPVVVQTLRHCIRSIRDTVLRSSNVVITLGRRQSKTPILSRSVDQKSLETEFSIAICRHTDDKWQSKTLFLSIFDPRSSVVESVFDCHLPGEVM